MDRSSLVLALVGVAASGLGCGAGDDGALEGSTPTKDTVALKSRAAAGRHGHRRAHRHGCAEKWSFSAKRPMHTKRRWRSAIW